jgi:hypothetical protein
MGRHDELGELQRPTSSEPHATVQVLHGIGGIGKTQLALRYAQIHAMNGKVKVGWHLDAGNRNYIVSGLARLGVELGLPTSGDIADSARNALREIERRGNWLLIFDDVHQQEDLQGLLPLGSVGKVIITSRLGDWHGTYRALEVNPLSDEIAVEFLIGRTKETDMRAALNLVRRLAGLPLALEQAAAYCRSSGVALRDYLLRLEAAPARVLAEGHPPGYRGPVAQTWHVSLGEVRRRNPACLEVLALLAYLAPVPVPRDILGAAPNSLPRRIRRIVHDEISVDATLRELTRLSLISVEADTLLMHPLMQTVIQDQVRRAAYSRWRPRVSASAPRRERQLVNGLLVLMVAAFPRPRWDGAQTDQWERCAILRPHAEELLRNAAHYSADPLRIADLGFWLGYYLDNRGDYAAARKVHWRTIAIRRRFLGDGHTDTLDAMGNLAFVERATGNLAAAARIHQHVLTSRKRTLGPRHPDTLISMNNLGRVRYLMGDSAGARELLGEALEGFLSVRGVRHQNTLGALSNLALVVEAEGNLSEAEEMFRKSLATQRRILGETDPDTLRSMSYLARVVGGQGDVGGALPIMESALALQRTMLGDTHPDTLRSMEDLSSLLVSDGQNDAANKVRVILSEARHRRFSYDWSWFIDLCCATAKGSRHAQGEMFDTLSELRVNGSLSARFIQIIEDILYGMPRRSLFGLDDFERLLAQTVFTSLEAR